MKITKQIVRKIKADMETILDKLGYETSEVSMQVNPIRTMNDLYMKAFYCRKYESTNPNALIEGKRVLPYTPDTEIYPCNSNQDHLNTMFKHILAEWILEI